MIIFCVIKSVLIFVMKFIFPCHHFLTVLLVLKLFTFVAPSTTTPSTTTTILTTTSTPTTPTTTPTTPSPTPTTPSPTTPFPAIGKIWALLVAGSNGYFNYRHQADICHAYQILHENGIPDENIIVMMYDDIAFSKDNPRHGVIINKPGGENMYKNVLKDYTGSDVNPENFLNILKGNKAAMEGIGSGKVINSGPNDHIFVNFADHGAPGSLMFPDSELLADSLISVLEGMSNANRFSKLVFYVEACFSGSMFDSLLAPDTNIFALTAADPHESSFACYYDEELYAYVGDCFSVNWMEDTEKESLSDESLNLQFEIVRTETNTSHVEEYGDLDIGSTKLDKIIGSRRQNVRRRDMKQSRTIGAVPSIDVPINILKNKLQKTKNKYEKRDLKMKLHQVNKKRKTVDVLFNNLVSNVCGGNVSRETDINSLKSTLNKSIFPCYRTLFSYFSENCFKVSKNPYVAVHLQKFVNFCSLPWTREATMIDAIGSECSGWQKQFVGVHSVI